MRVTVNGGIAYLAGLPEDVAEMLGYALVEAKEAERQAADHDEQERMANMTGTLRMMIREIEEQDR